MFDKMKQMYELKKQADAMKKELEAEVIEIEHGEVTVKVDGTQKIKSLNFPADIEPEKVKDAVNKAMDEVQKIAAKKMQGMMGMGGMSDLLKG